MRWGGNGGFNEPPLIFPRSVHVLIHFIHMIKHQCRFKYYTSKKNTGNKCFILRFIPPPLALCTINELQIRDRYQYQFVLSITALLIYISRGQYKWLQGNLGTSIERGTNTSWKPEWGITKWKEYETKHFHCIIFFKENYADIKKGKDSDYRTGHYDSNSPVTTKIMYNGPMGWKISLFLQKRSHDFSEGSHILVHTIEDTVIVFFSWKDSEA